MILWRLFADLLTIMIENHEQIFQGLQAVKDGCLGDGDLTETSTMLGQPKVEIVETMESMQYQTTDSCINAP